MRMEGRIDAVGGRNKTLFMMVLATVSPPETAVNKHKDRWMECTILPDYDTKQINNKYQINRYSLDARR